LAVFVAVVVGTFVGMYVWLRIERAREEVGGVIPDPTRGHRDAAGTPGTARSSGIGVPQL
jgi:hypothetical protein